jgi:phosphoribosyl 1,2-cyclic phosphodiesterase
MRVIFLGVRGSTPAPGPPFVRVGGNTSCVAVARDHGPPPLVLDAGTGLRRLTTVLDGAPFRGTILLTHLHWDHAQGLPFFAAGDRDDAQVTLVLPDQGSAAGPAEDVLARAMSPPHFPIGPSGLRGKWAFEGIEPGEHSIEGFTVVAAEVPHKGGRTFGYRVSDGARSFAYVPDHGPRGLGPGPDGLGARHEQVLALAKGVDVLVHGGQFTQAEHERATDFGHATIDYALALAEDAGVGRLVLFHHDPGRTDDQVDALMRDVAGRLPDGVTATAAVEELELAI